MAEIKKEVPEIVEGEVVSEVAVTRPEKMEFRLINPTEDSFLRKIKWNKAELTTVVKRKIASYKNVVYTEDNMKQAKADRAELKKLINDIEECRKMVKKILNEPYKTFEAEVKEILALIQEPVGIIDKQVKEFENLQKEEKKSSIQQSYDEVIGDLAEVLPFEKVFDSRYLNQTYKLATAQADVKAKVEKVRTDLETIDSLESKYKLNAKDVYIKTLNLSEALAENKRLSDLEEKLEAEKRRKAEEEAERKRLEEERRKDAEAKEKSKEEVEQEASDVEQAESVGKAEESVGKAEESVSKAEESVSKHVENFIEKPQNVQQAVDPFIPKHEKKYRMKFCVVGTREQLEKLIQFMNENEIEYGRINND